MDHLSSRGRLLYTDLTVLSWAIVYEQYPEGSPILSEYPENCEDYSLSQSYNDITTDILSSESDFLEEFSEGTFWVE